MSKALAGLAFIVAAGTLEFGYSAMAEQQKSGPQTSGYIDVQYQWGRGELNLNGAQLYQGTPNTFRVNQGAIMLSDEIDNAEAFLDIPFRQSTIVGAQGNDLELGTKEAQAYVKYQYDSGINWQFGQFDSYFGLEGNDSADIIFPTHGIMHGFTPYTHTGIGVGYQFIPFFFQAVLANSNGAGTQTDKDSPDLGIKLGWSQEPVQFSIGALITKTSGNYPLNTFLNEANYKPRVAVNSVLQIHFKHLDLAAEVDIARSRLSKAYVNGQVIDHDLVYGMILQAAYNVADKWIAAIRYEYLKNDESNEYVQAAQKELDTPAVLGSTITGQGGFLSKMSFAVRRTISEDLVAKAGVDVHAVNIGKDAVGRTVGWSTAELALVYDF